MGAPSPAGSQTGSTDEQKHKRGKNGVDEQRGRQVED